MRVKDDPDQPGALACLVAGCLVIKLSPVACDERAVGGPAAERLEMTRPSEAGGPDAAVRAARYEGRGELGEALVISSQRRLEQGSGT